MSNSLAKKGATKERGFVNNPVIPGKERILMTIVGPNCRQKADKYCFKVHDVCSFEEAKERGDHFRRMGDVDVFEGDLGAWQYFDDDVNNAKDIDYIDNAITEMLKDKRRENAKAEKGFGKKVKDAMDGDLKEATTEKRLVGKREPAIAVFYKIEQLRQHIRFRQNEIETLLDVFHRKYTKAERNECKKVELPLSKPSPMQFSQMSGLEEDESSDEEESDESGNEEEEGAEE